MLLQGLAWKPVPPSCLDFHLQLWRPLIPSLLATCSAPPGVRHPHPPGMPAAEYQHHFLCKATLIHPVSWLRVSPEESNPTPIYRSLMMAAPTLGARGWAQQDWAGHKHRGSEMAETLAHFPAWELWRGCSRRQSLAQPGGGVGRRDGRPQATPPPIQVLMSSSRDLEAPGRTGGPGGWRAAWVPAHLVSRAQPHPQPQAPRKATQSPEVGLTVPRTVCHSSWHKLSTHLGLPTCFKQLPEGKGGGSPIPGPGSL